MDEFADSVEAFVKKAKARVNQVVVGSILEFTARVEDRTPVDTGFLRANWRLGVDEVPRGTLDIGGAALSYVLNPGGFNGVIPEEAAGHVYYLANGAKYARRIEYGFTGQDSLGRHYHQPGRGMVGLTLSEWPDIVRRQANAAAGR